MNWRQNLRNGFLSRNCRPIMEKRNVIIETDQEVIYISGALRANHWPAIRTTAYLVYASYPLGVTLDFAGIQCVSPMGEATFANALADIERHALPFALAYVPSDVAARLRQGTERILPAPCANMTEERHIRQAIFSDAWWQKLWGASKG